MLVHIVLVRGPEGMSAEDREEMAQALGSLAKVPGVKDMTWGPDVSARGKGYTHAAVMNFDDDDALQSYQVDAAHQEVVATFNRLSVDRLIIDYEIDSKGMSA